jgi:hypothetical protein
LVLRWLDWREQVTALAEVDVEETRVLVFVVGTKAPEIKQR